MSCYCVYLVLHITCFMRRLSATSSLHNWMVHQGTFYFHSVWIIWWIIEHGTSEIPLLYVSVIFVLILESELPKYDCCNYLCSDWLLSGALARMLFAASEENGDCSSLTSSGMYCYSRYIIFLLLSFNIFHFSFWMSFLAVFSICYSWPNMVD